jgi:hypothetical protein
MYLEDMFKLLGGLKSRIDCTPNTYPAFIPKGDYGCIQISHNKELYQFLITDDDHNLCVDYLIDIIVNTFQKYK